MMNKLEKSMLEFLKQNQAEVATPGLVLRVYRKRRKCIDIVYGKTSCFYDIASITKVMLTMTRLMMLRKDKLFNETSQIQKVIPWFKAGYSFERLLAHQSGAIAWKPYFKKMSLKASRQERWLWLQKQLRAETSFQKSFSKVRTSIYSDVGFLLLGVALEYLESQSLLHSWQKVQEAFKLQKTHFNIDHTLKYKVSKYAPTEKCAWRKKQLQGQVSDENAYALGGVAPHAGLFSTIDDVSSWILQLRDIFYGKVSKFIDQSTLKKFTQTSRSDVDFALGFMKPCFPRVVSQKKVNSCGQYFSRHSFGHTGFSGTSVWFDPRKDIIIVLLSNRICPNRDNKKFVTLRPLLHDYIVMQLTS